MKNLLKVSYEEARKLLKIDKRTRKSHLKNIDNLEYPKKLALIIFFTEFEQKSKEFKKFGHILREKYTVKDLYEAHHSLFLFLLYPKKDVVAALSTEKRGLEIISKIYKTYNFLKENEKLELVEKCLKNNVINHVLQKETGKICYKGKIEETLDLLDKEDVLDSNILQSCTSLKIMKYFNGKTFDNLKTSKDKQLFKNMLYCLFEEGNYQYIEILTKENPNIHNLILSYKENTLKGLALRAYFHGNTQTDLEVLKKLAISFDLSYKEVLEGKNLLLKFKYPKFTEENTRKYIKDNLWVSSFVSKLFNYTRELLPDNILSILQEENLNYTDYYKLIDSIGFKHRTKLIYKDSFFEVAMKSRSFKKFMLEKGGFTHFEEQDLVKFISKFTKREDFEFYLLFFIVEKQNKEYETYLEAYKTNSVIKESQTVHMVIYNHITNIRSILNNGSMANDAKIFELYCKGLIRAIGSLNIEKCLTNIIDVSLLSVISAFLPKIYDIVPHFKEEIHCFYEQILRFNKVTGDEVINKVLWDSLISIPQLFVEYIDCFYKFEDIILGNIIKNRKIDVELQTLEKYEGSSLMSTVVDYVVRNYTLKEVLDVLLSKYEDERDFYYEIVMFKSKNQEYDCRILKLEDSPWLDKIFNEIFAVEKDEIFEMLRINRPEFLFDYSVRHKIMRRKYFELIDKKKCTKTTAFEIFKIIEKERDSVELCDTTNFIEAIYGDKEVGNFEYQCAVSFLENLDNLSCDKLDLIYLLSFIRPDDGQFFLFKYFDLVAEEILNMKKHQTKQEEEMAEKIDFILSVYLSDKYFVFVVMEKLINCMRKSTQTGKYLLLKNFDSKNVTRCHISEFLDVITSLLHDTNVNIYCESKRLLNNVSFTSPEMHSLRSQLIQCLIDKIYVRPFFETLFLQTFNHYMCINSLTLLVQVLRVYIKDFKEDVLYIIRYLPNIVKPSDFSYIVLSIFNILSKFVIEYQFYTEEVVKTVSVLLKHSKNVDFTLLVDNIEKSLSVGCLLVNTLKECDIEVQRSVTGRIIRKDDDVLNVTNNFLAYAPELTVFNEYISHFIPILKNMYESDDYDKRKIAFNAFERIEVADYLIQTALVGVWAIRLNTLDLFLKKNSFGDKELSVIFILRHDPHSVVRKKAYDLWKLNVENPNKKLKDLHQIIFEYVRFINNSNALRDSVQHTISEIVTKYVKYCEIYIREYFLEGDLFDFSCKDEKLTSVFKYSFDESLSKLPYIDVIEIILLECAKSNKMMELTYKFAEQFISVKIYKTLISNSGYKESIIELIKKNMEDPRLKEIFEDSSLSYELYNLTGNNLLLENIKESERFRLLKTNLEDSERVRSIFQSSCASLELEEFVLDKHVGLQFLYLANIQRLKNHGKLQKIFNSVFMRKKDGELQELIKKSNSKNVLETTYKNIRNFDGIIRLILQSNTLLAIERLEEIIDYVENSYLESLSLSSTKNNIEMIVGYLFFNYLFYENRNGVKNCMVKLLGRLDLKEYKEIINRTIFAK